MGFGQFFFYLAKLLCQAINIGWSLNIDAYAAMSNKYIHNLLVRFFLTLEQHYLPTIFLCTNTILIKCATVKKG